MPGPTQGSPVWFKPDSFNGPWDVPTLLITSYILFNWVEVNRWQDMKNPGSVSADPIHKGYSVKGTDVGYPGFDPLTLGSGPADKVKKVRVNEIKNARLAMTAFAGLIAQVRGRSARGRGGGGGRRKGWFPPAPCRDLPPS